MKFFVIGGMNLDVTGWCRAETMLHDSNIGNISFSAGGVGHNIAGNLADAGCEVQLITAVSTRPEAQMLTAECAARGIGLDYAVFADASVNCYMAVHGGDGDLVLAVNDMDSVKLITPECVEKALDAINASDGCVLDANISEETVRYAAAHITVPIAADSVSAIKCARLAGALSNLSLIKLNQLEAQTLTGEKNADEAAKQLIEKGVKRVIVSMGAKGAYAADINGGVLVPPARVYDCQTNGAGDAMCAGASIGMAQGESALECLKMGMERSDRLLSLRMKR